MSLMQALQGTDPTSSLVKFVLGLYDGVIEGDARAALERIRAYRYYHEAIGMDNEKDADKVAAALREAVGAGVLPAPLINKGTIITGRFAAQTEWLSESGGEVSVGVGAVTLSVNASASYQRQQSEASEFTIHLEPTNVDMFTALAAIHTDANKSKVLPKPQDPPQGGSGPAKTKAG